MSIGQGQGISAIALGKLVSEQVHITHHCAAIAHNSCIMVSPYSLMLQCCAERDNTEANQAAHAQWEPYTPSDIEAAQASTSGRSSDSPSGLSNTFTNFVTQTYARSSLLADAPLCLSSTHSSPTPLTLHKISANISSKVCHCVAGLPSVA